MYRDSVATKSEQALSSAHVYLCKQSPHFHSASSKADTEAPPQLKPRII